MRALLVILAVALALVAVGAEARFRHKAGALNPPAAQHAPAAVHHPTVGGAPPAHLKKPVIQHPPTPASGNVQANTQSAAVTAQVLSHAAAHYQQQGAAATPAELRALFAQFKAKNQKVYSSVGVEERAFEVFVNNHRRAQSLNAQFGKGREIWSALGRFGDVDPNEFRTKRLGLRRPAHAPQPTLRHAAPVPAHAAAAAPHHHMLVDVSSESTTETVVEAEVVGEAAAEAELDQPAARAPLDWRTKGMVTAVKDQGQCGDCWSHAATEGLETASLMAGKGSFTLSPQAITDCRPWKAAGSYHSCDGDWPSSAWESWQTNSSVLLSQYPYAGNGDDDSKATLEDCKPTVGQGPRAAAWAYSLGQECTTAPCTIDENALYQSLAQHGPFVVSVDASSFQTYQGGVLPAASCSSDPAKMDHAVQVVAYGNDAQDGEYWVIRNSWGSSWGESGYVRVQYGQNACGIGNYAMYVTA